MYECLLLRQVAWPTPQPPPPPPLLLIAPSTTVPPTTLSRTKRKKGHVFLFFSSLYFPFCFGIIVNYYSFLFLLLLLLFVFGKKYVYVTWLLIYREYNPCLCFLSFFIFWIKVYYSKDIQFKAKWERKLTRWCIQIR